MCYNGFKCTFVETGNQKICFVHIKCSNVNDSNTLQDTKHSK